MGIVMDGGGRSVKFEAIGDTVEGKITDVEELPLLNYDTGMPELWSDGRPKTQIRATIHTELCEDGTDDGQRNLYIKGHLWIATRDAIRAAGSKSIDVGATIKVRFDAEGEVKKRGYQPPKLFKVKYSSPAAGVALADDDF